MRIFDNIGCEFSYNFNDKSFTLLSALPGYSALPLNSAGNVVPYLARNIDGKNIQYELGVGYLEQINNKLILKDKKISLSSNNNSDVDFTKTGSKHFYIFVHNVNFDNAFNNIFVKNTNFLVESRKSIYVVDVSSGYIICKLPDPTKCEAVEVEFKTIGDGGSLRLDNTGIVLDNDSYTKLVSTGKEWIELKDKQPTDIPFSSLSKEEIFSTLSDPTGNDRALQYNDNGSFGASSIYQGDNNKLLFGSSDDTEAKHIMPASGSYDFVVNATKDGSSFIVYGTGNSPGYPEKNLYFSYDGKFGINMPSGVNTGSIVKPSTVLHVFNTLCREGIRLENRANCYIADITLYDNPFTSPRPDGSGIARVVFAGKDSLSNKTDYAKIEAKVKSSSSKLGQLDLIVKNDTEDKTTISSSADRTLISSDSASVDINNSTISISGTSVSVTGTTVSISGSNLNLNSSTTSVTEKLRLSYLTGLSNPLLSINESKEVVIATGFRLPGLEGVSEGNILTTTEDGSVVAQISKDSFWPYESGSKIGGKDLRWDRYQYVSASACEGKDTQELDLSANLNEFSIGDQLAILNLADGTTIYNIISGMIIEDDVITRLNLNDNINIPSGSNLRVYSVSKGGILTNAIYTSGIASDSTANVLSTRPDYGTTFNTLHKNIDFSIFGDSSTPAFKLTSETNSITINSVSGYEFGSDTPFNSGTGEIASLSVSGYLYTDSLKVGNLYLPDTDRDFTSVINTSGSTIAVSGNTVLVNQSGLTEEDLITNKVVITPEKTYFTQPIIITTGNISSLSTSSGFRISHSGIDIIASGGGIVEGGLNPGPTGAFLYKNENNILTSVNSNLRAVDLGDGEVYPQLPYTSGFGVLYSDSNAIPQTTTFFSVNRSDITEIEPKTSQIVSIRGTGTGIPPILYTSRILVGPPLSSYSGSLLTHSGNEAAYWQPNEFLKAPGATWTRYIKRAIELNPNRKEFNFVDLDPSKGGTGPVTIEELREEFSVNETIAIYNQNRDVAYVKVSNIGLVESRDGTVNINLFTGDEEDLAVGFCPILDQGFLDGSALVLGENDADNGRLIAYAFSIQKGAYLDMAIEPEATDLFACTGTSVGSEYSFKPSTFNTLSIRPGIYTAFNKIADDIDFVVYGHRKTLFTRYEPDWFDQDEHGVPTGLMPAMRVHAKVDNSYLGSVESGVFRDTIGLNNVASGITPDIKAKITINTNNPYIIASLTGIKLGTLLPGATSSETLAKEKEFGIVIPETGVMLSGVLDISNYADLTVNGTTYSSGIITKDIVLGPLWTGEVPVPYEVSLAQKVYAPNYPLTINQLGQIVSMIPPPTPEAPSAPLAVSGIAKNNAIELKWQKPADDGGEPVLGYIVEYSADDGDNWIPYDQIDTNTSLPVISDANISRILTENIFNNTGYIFRVTAYNSVGIGTTSSASAEITPTSVGILPAPTNFRITEGENSDGIRNSVNITLSWDGYSVPVGHETDFVEFIIEYRAFDSENRDLTTGWVSSSSWVLSSIGANSIQLTGISIPPLYYFSIKVKGITDGEISLSNRIIYTSLGSDPSPIDYIPPEVPEAENPYDFGTIIFTGNCS